MTDKGPNRPIGITRPGNPFADTSNDPPTVSVLIQNENQKTVWKKSDLLPELRSSPMAASFANFLSFILPSKPPQPQAPPLAVAQTLPKPCQSSGDRFAPISLSQAQDQPPVQPPVDLSAAVVCPSLAYANTLYFSSGYNVQVLVEDNEPEERLLGRFRREVMKAGVIQECKRRQFFENSQDERKRKAREATKRTRRRRPFSRVAAQNNPETNAKKKADDDDNWEMPEEGTSF